MLNGKSDSKYPFEFIGEGDCEMPYSKMKKPTHTQMWVSG